MGSHSFLQGIFLTQGSNSGLLQCRQILYHLSHQGSPYLSNIPWNRMWGFLEQPQFHWHTQYICWQLIPWSPGLTHTTRLSQQCLFVWNNAISSNMDGSIDCHTKWSQTEINTTDITYTWNKTNKQTKKRYKWPYLQNRNRLTVIENKYGYQRVGGEDKSGIWD